MTHPSMLAAVDTSLDTVDDQLDAHQAHDFKLDASPSFVITYIEAHDVAVGLRRIPFGFLVLFQSDGRTWRTSNNPMQGRIGTVEWRDEIPLPTNLSALVDITVSASFEFAAMLGRGEVLRTLQISVNDLLDHSERGQPITFLPIEGEPLTSCSSMLLRVESRSDLTPIPSQNSLDFEDDSTLADMTNKGHDALLRYRKDQRAEDLAYSIQCFGCALNVCPIDRRCRSSVLFNLATAKFVKCQVDPACRPADFDAPISLYRAALGMRGVRHPDRPTTLLYLALALVSRFGNGGSEDNASEASELVEQVRGLCAPEDYQHKYLDLVLYMCAETRASVRSAATASMLTMFWERCNQFLSPHRVASYTVGMLTRAATAAQEYWDRLVRPTDPVDEMMIFATALSVRYDQSRDVADLNLLVIATRTVVYGIPKNHPERSKWLACFSSASYERFKHLGSLLDLHEAIRSGEEAVEATPPHPDLSMVFSHLNVAFLGQFARLGNMVDLHKAILMGEKAVLIAPYDHPKLHTMRSSLSNALRYRFERLGDVSDLENAISGCEEAEKLIPHDHPDMTVVLNNLSTALCDRFQRYGDMVDLDKAISKGEKAIRVARDGGSDTPTCLSNLAIAFFNRYDRTGSIADIDRSISVAGEAVRLTARGHPDMPDWLNNLGAALLRRFTRLQDTVDVDRAILAIEEAVKATPYGHPDLYWRLHSLGVAFIKRYDQLNQITDLERAISAGERGLRDIPYDHPNRLRIVELLGIILHDRFRRFKDIADLDRAISLGEEVINSTPHGHPSFPNLLSNHSSRLVSRFNELGDIIDIDKGISMGTEAAQIIPEEHPDLSMILRNLGLAFLSRFERLDNRADFRSAIAHFSRAACLPLSPSSARLRASLLWISCAHKLGDTSLLDAYSCTITLLPQVAWLGLHLKSRYRELLLAADVARDAAATALELGHAEMAVEWLEQGRCVVWGQHFQLRTPVDELRSLYPSLADRLERLSSELELASTSDDPLTVQGTREPLEQRTQRTHALAVEWEQLLKQIRSMSGFERFLLPKPCSQLKASAHSGPVVLLNASKQRCDALVITTDSDTVLHVPLSNMSYGHAEHLRTMLNSSLIHRGRSADERAARQIKLHGMSFILTELWRDVVRPVLSALNLLTHVPRKQPRVFWCPTGPLTFLPIHAAGIYGSAGPDYKIDDFVISSYIPTLGVLFPPPGRDLSEHVRLLVIPQPPSDGQTPLSGTLREMTFIKEVVSNLSPSRVTVVESNGTVEQVLNAMRESDWVHFACHGVQDLASPTDSGLCLADGRRLKLSDIVHLSRPRRGLAFLSACQTATGDEALSEEAVHLAAGMLLAGYGGVIGTMWSILDNVAPGVAKNVYEVILGKDGLPDYGEAARALHDAVGRLRSARHVTDEAPEEDWFLSWVPFVHVGL